MFNPKVGDLVYIQWDDHCSYHGSAWRRVNEIAAAMTGSACETVGFVVNIDRDNITTAASMTVGEDADCSQIATRLRRAITRGKIIKRF